MPAGVPSEVASALESLKGSLAGWTPERIESETGVSGAAVAAAAKRMRDAERKALLFGRGVLEHAQAAGLLQAIENLAWALGAIGTDALTAEAVALEVGRRTGVLVTPAQAFGMAEHHLGFAGTISLQPATLLAVMHDLVLSLARHGFERIYVINGHGGNSALLNVANRELRLAHGLMTFLAHPGVPPDQGGVSPAHELGMATVLWCYLRNSKFKVENVNYETSADLTGQANHLGVT